MGIWGHKGISSEYFSTYFITPLARSIGFFVLVFSVLGEIEDKLNLESLVLSRFILIALP